MSIVFRAALAAAIFAVPATPALAADLTYQPINPSFGGNPFNSAHLLGIANAQNKFKDPDAANSGSDADIFARQLQSRLLSALSSQITDAIFGENAKEHGVVNFDGQTIEWQRGLDEVTLTITNNDTGEVTTIEVPTIVNI
jgi:curli production assembly/transport component CsgF